MPNADAQKSSRHLESKTKLAKFAFQQTQRYTQDELQATLTFPRPCAVFVSPLHSAITVVSKE